MRAAKPRPSVRDWPRLTRFYGIPPSELVRMPNALIEVYADALRELHAEEVLLAFLASDMPYMSVAQRKKAQRDFQRFIPRPEDVPKIDTSTEGGKAAAAALGIKVVPSEPAIESIEDSRKELT